MSAVNDYRRGRPWRLLGFLKAFTSRTDKGIDQVSLLLAPAGNFHQAHDRQHELQKGFLKFILIFDIFCIAISYPIWQLKVKIGLLSKNHSQI